MVQSNIRVTFQRELSALQDQVVRLGSMVDEAIKKAMQALKTRDIDLAREVVAGDGEINELRFKLEEACVRLIAQQQPICVRSSQS